MDQRKKAVIEAGKWLSAKRSEMDASSMLVARMATFDSGLIADALGQVPTGTPDGPREETFYIQSASGEIVGRLTWFAGRPG